VTAIEKCRLEQKRAALHILNGGDDTHGAMQGMSDWMMEEILEQQELSYSAFLDEKLQYGADGGFDPLWIPDGMFDFQRVALEWAVRKGRGALLFDCGMGKSFIELAWAQNIVQKTNKRVLLLTPLAVGSQMVEEGEKFGIEAKRSLDGSLGAKIVVANYERLHYFNPNDFGAVVCDESSCLKSYDAKRKAAVTEFCRTIPYRLLGTATAAPNDYIELGTSSEALGYLGHIDMLNRFFKNDQNTSDTKLMKRTQGGGRAAGWRFKGHAEQPFWRWVCSWARAARRPSDLGEFNDDRFVLPPLIENEHVVECKKPINTLFQMTATNMREEREERRRTIEERCEKAAELVHGTGKPSVVWCHLNDEGDLLEDLIPGSQQIAGSTPDDKKEEIYKAFSKGQLKDLIIKDKIGAWGSNWQHCNHVVRFATHSYESHYQAIRRCWRFGQKNPVTVDLIASEGEQGIKDNLQRKSQQADRMFTELVRHMQSAMAIERVNYTKKAEIPSWLTSK
jgi:hypothetical protein